MILMKKIATALLAFTLLILTGCGTASGGNIEGTLDEILTKVTDGATDSEMKLMTTEVTDDNFSWYFFVEPIEGAEGLASEAAVNAIAHTIALLRVPDGTDAETVRADIEKNIDPRKWVCVEAEKTAVVRHGNLILVAMSDAATVEKAVKNFDALAK